jgi:murein DD-endopeptidase MepM/ murein hydrolase activator NlpD
VRHLVSPLPTPLSPGSEFDTPDPEGAPDRRGVRYHAGKDWFAPAGSPLFSPIDGRVVEVKPSRGSSGQVFGGTVKIQAPNGRVFVFRHIDPYGGLNKGARVRAAQPIASVTAWQDAPDRSHAHVEIWRTLSGGYRKENMLDPAEVFGV